MPLFIRAKSLKVQPSVVGYIAKAIARIGQGEPQAGIRAFDLAFIYCGLEEIPFLFLIRVRPLYPRHVLLLTGRFMQCVILFETGEQDDAMKRVHDLIDTVDDKMVFYAVQVCS